MKVSIASELDGILSTHTQTIHTYMGIYPPEKGTLETELKKRNHISVVKSDNSNILESNKRLSDWTSNQ